MNGRNYQLDNTSVFLGGQCRWDIVLKKKGDGVVEVSNFQLAPLSDSIAFNKDTDQNIIRTNHSENLKNFYNKLREDFWNTDPYTNYPRYEVVNGNTIDDPTVYDITCLRGPRRLQEFSLYRKQFGYLQPIWLEKVSENQTLKFVFKSYTLNSEGERIPVDQSTLELSQSADNEFHNNFVNYFYNWLKYINTISDSYVNNQILNVDLKNKKATIRGINVKTGQLSGDISVNNLIDNFFYYERPLMDTDNIITTQFKNNDLITSQLFNFNFCFNLDDIIDGVLLNLVKTANIAIDCEVYLGDEQEDEQLDCVRLFTNYEYIDKDQSDLYVMMNDITVDSSTSEISENYKFHKPDTLSTNVLDYLKDYDDPVLSTKNKLTQPIVHWGYTNTLRNTFNLYDGYCGQYMDVASRKVETVDEPDGSHTVITYELNPYYIPYSNGISILDFPTTYTKGSNNITWVSPGKVLYFWNNNEPFSTTMSIQANYINMYKNDFFNAFGTSIKDCCEFWGVEQDDSISDERKILFVYSNVNGATWTNWFTPLSSSIPCTTIIASGDNVKIGKILVGDIDNYIVITTNPKYTLLQNIIDLVNASTDADDDAKEFFKSIKSVIQRGNDGHYISFENEICAEQLNDQQVYLRKDSKTTLINRCDGTLEPYFVVKDSDKFQNYLYEKDVKKNQVNKTDDDVLKSYIEGVYKNGLNKIIYLSNVINFEYTRDLNGDDTTPQEKSIEIIKNVYSCDNDDFKLNYIYKLYNLTFTYDYVSETNISKIKYQCKLTLK